MAIRPAPKRKVDYQKLDDLQKQIFGSETGDSRQKSTLAQTEDNTSAETNPPPQKSAVKIAGNDSEIKIKAQSAIQKVVEPDKPSFTNKKQETKTEEDAPAQSSAIESLGEHLSDLETIAARISSSKAGHGRNTTRPFSLPRTLIIDTTRLKAKFRTIDEQFTQNVIIDFLLRESLAAATPDNYKDLRAAAFEFVKRAEETTRRSLTVTEDVVYQMSELKAGINLETGRKYSNDEIFSTLLAVGVGWLYRNGVLS